MIEEKILINEELLVTGLVEKKYITFNMSIINHKPLDSDDKKIIGFEFNLLEEVLENNEVITWGSKGNHFSIDVNLKDEEDIYSLTNALYCGISNALNKIFSKKSEKESGNN
jgi:hypothetical protein